MTSSSSSSSLKTRIISSILGYHHHHHHQTRNLITTQTTNTTTNHHHHNQLNINNKPIHPILNHHLINLSNLKPHSIYYQSLYQLGLISSLHPPSSSSSTILQLRHLTHQFVRAIRFAIQLDPHHPLSSLASDLINSVTTATRPTPTSSKSSSNPNHLQSIIVHILLSNFIPWAAIQSRSSSSSHHHPIPSRSSPHLTFEPQLQASLASISKSIDIRRPQDLYPHARRYKRIIHLHVGPTNSGKTHSALRALHSAHTGVYAGPLRLLAHEVFTRFNSGSIAHDLSPRDCNLITGEEHRIINPFAGLTSCTVEMLSCHQFYDLVIIDEIQMLGDPYRGDAWTQAFLSVQAKELHLCGEESVVELIHRLTESCGDRFQLHRYQRLTPLRVAESSLMGDLSKLRRGDCLVTFSRNSIYALKKSIQATTQLRVGMAYGALPPEVREKEAQMFNLGSQIEGQGGYDVLVGSDAIGMGLNLKIKRVIFESLHKFDGQNQVQLSTSQIKQIGGRAGRFGILPSHPRVPDGNHDDRSIRTDESFVAGQVLTLHETDMELLRRSMSAGFQPIHQAVIKAPFTTIEAFARRAPDPDRIRYSTLLELRKILTITPPEYSIGDEKNAASIGDAIESIRSLSLSERELFSSAPANPRSPIVMNALRSWARAHGNRTSVDFEAWLRSENVDRTIDSLHSSIPSTSDPHPPSTEPPSPLPGADEKQSSQGSREKDLLRWERSHHELLFRLESIHKCLVLYMWLSFRLPESFVDSQKCWSIKTRCEEVLEIGLMNSSSRIDHPHVLVHD